MADSNDNPPPTLRERQSQRVRDELRASFVAQVVEHGVHAFSLHDVAVAAGVSDRTLYRYFPNREALIDDLQTYTFTVIEEAKRARGQGRQLEGDWDPHESLADVFEVFEEHADLVRASALIRESGLADTRHDARTGNVRDNITRFDVHPDAVDALSALVRMLTSSDGWARLTSPEFGLEARQAGLAAHWAAQVLVKAAVILDGPLRPTYASENGADGDDREG